MPSNNLTLREERFVNLVADPSIKTLTEAAEKAGYQQPAHTGSKNHRKPHIQAAIAQRKAQLSASLGDKARENAEKALSLQASALVQAQSDDALAKVQVGAVVIRSSKEWRESFGEREEQLIDSSLRLKAKRRVLRAMLRAARRGERLVPLLEARIAELG